MDEAQATADRRKVVVLGSGPIRIGQGIEFDYCSVHSVQSTEGRWASRSIIINSNPETVSTDFDTSDKLYFEPLTKECVLDIIEKEQPEGVIVQFGGQTAINLAGPLEESGVKILGTSVEDIDRAEDRDRFITVLKDLDIPLPSGGTAFSLKQAEMIAQRIGYPALVRPSYVLGGRAMEIVYNDRELKEYMRYAVDVSPVHPVLVDKYILGKEIELDGVSDGQDVLIVGIMEHIERAGVHSGDSFAVYPSRTLSAKVKETIADYGVRIGRALRIKGLFNIQFALDKDDHVFVLEVNPRASRTVPVLSKVTGVPMVSVATGIMLGRSLKDYGYSTGLYRESPLVTVKAPVFSFSKMTTVDIFLGPEMKSTGEVMGTDYIYAAALKKAFEASGIVLPEKGTEILFCIADRDKEEALSLARQMAALGYGIFATDGTSAYFTENGMHCGLIKKDGMLSALKEGQVGLVVNTPTRGKQPDRQGFILRRTAMEFNVPCITSIDTANAMLSVMSDTGSKETCIPLHEYLQEVTGGNYGLDQLSAG